MNGTKSKLRNTWNIIQHYLALKFDIFHNISSDGNKVSETKFITGRERLIQTRLIRSST